MSAEVNAGFRLNEHPLRRTLADEVHARPFAILPPPVRASHLALAHGETGARADLAALADLCARYGMAPPEAGATHFAADFGAFSLRWEGHTEFSTYTFYRFEAFDDPFAAPALDLCPADWLAALPGMALAAVHLALDGVRRDADCLNSLFAGHSIIGSTMVGGRAEAFTDFRLHPDGFGRILVYDLGLTHGQAGRVTQRLLEIETYRILALLAFPVARRLGPELAEMTTVLSDITAALAQPGGDADDRALLERLSALAARAEQQESAHGYRFSAAEAYAALVRKRIEDLRETRIAGMQTFGEFMDRRLEPAMKTCQSTARRHTALVRHIARTGALLRTRVDIALEEKNRDLLKSMNRRAELQLRLQETVEGLSVVAISYYCLALLGDAARGLHAVGLPVDSEVAMLAGLPVVVIMVALGVRRLRKAVSGHTEP